VKNVDRVLFGAAVANYSATMATALLNVDAAADKLTPAMISLAKRRAKTSGSAAGSNRIMPYKTKDGRELYVLFVDSNGFRDLRNNTDMMAANRDARVRSEDNVIFSDGDLLWDGVVIKEIPEIPVLAGAGAAAIDVGTAFLCGRGALTLAYSEQPTPRTQMEDYDFSHGVGLEECRSLTGMKTSFNGIQYGVVTVFHASVAD
jgi:hypothetical protein